MDTWIWIWSPSIGNQGKAASASLLLDYCIIILRWLKTRNSTLFSWNMDFSCSSLSGRNWVRKREDRAQMKLSTIYSQQSKPLLRRKEQQPNVILNHWYKWNPSICRHFWKLLFFSGSKMHSLMNDWMAYMSGEFSLLLNRKMSWIYPRRTF